MSRKVSKNIMALVLSRILAGALVLVGYASLFRYLGPFRSGQFQFALSYVLLFGVVVDFGIQQLVIKKVSEQKTDSPKYLGNFFAVEFVLSIFVYLILVAVAVLSRYDPIVTKAIALAGFGMFLNALTIPFTAVISAHEDMHVLAVVNFFDSVVNVAIMFLAIHLRLSIFFLSSVQAVNGIMHILVYSRVIHKYIDRLNLFQYLRQFDFALVKKMILAALPFGALVGFSIIYNKIDVIILFHLRGEVETGLYTTAYKVFDFLAFFPAVVSSSLYPFFSSQMKQGNIQMVQAALEGYTKYMVALALPVAFGGAVLAPKFNLLLAGPNYYEGFKALQILVFGTAILFIYSAVNSLMISQLTRHAVIATFLNIFINALGNLILVPRFGFKAAAFMTVVSELNQAAFYFYFVRKKIVSFSFAKYFFVPAIAAAVMSLVIYWLREYNLLIIIPLGVIVYIFVIAAGGFFEKKDLGLFKLIMSGGNA